LSTPSIIHFRSAAVCLIEPERPSASPDDNTERKGKERMSFKKMLGACMVLGIMAVPMGLMAKGNPMVGGAAMYPSKDIVDNAVNSADHTTLVSAVKAADLVDTLKSKGPFTVFAPTNEAFGLLPAGTVDSLLKPESKTALSKVLTYHVVAGKMDSAEIAKKIKAGNGKATFKPVSGGTLTAMMEGSNLVLKDEKGGTAKVTIADVHQSNGVIHVVDHVLMPS
jgi:uncharacterized surface protein with fasciclin (FAS1) repeats